MIPKDFITAWRAQAPWRLDAHVEQDLIISRAIFDIFSVPDLANSLLFRGGTALYKIHISPPARYSEDIDLVQVRAEPIGEILDRVRAVLDPWLGEPRRVFKQGRSNLVYRFESEEAPPLKLKLKIEVNTREHFNVLGVEHIPFEVMNPWFSGAVSVSTYALDELLCTKLRALYQRKKGRDLFDLWYAMKQGMVDPSRLLACFERYMAADERTVTRAQFEANLAEKRQHPGFREDVKPLLRPGLSWDFEVAMDSVITNLVGHLPGEPWKGGG